MQPILGKQKYFSTQAQDARGLDGRVGTKILAQKNKCEESQINIASRIFR
jgi:hypothetical protein